MLLAPITRSPVVHRIRRPSPIRQCHKTCCDLPPEAATRLPPIILGMVWTAACARRYSCWAPVWLGSALPRVVKLVRPTRLLLSEAHRPQRPLVGVVNSNTLLRTVRFAPVARAKATTGALGPSSPNMKQPSRAQIGIRRAPNLLPVTRGRKISVVFPPALAYLRRIFLFLRSSRLTLDKARRRYQTLFRDSHIFSGD
jgi:hypothetical protein